MSGKANTRIKMFDPDGIVYYLGNDVMLKEQVEYGLNIKTIQIGTVDKLVQQIQDVLNSKVWTTFIFTESMSEQLKGFLDDIVEVFTEKFCKDYSASIIELGISGKYFNQDYPNVFRYANVDSLASDKNLERQGWVVEKARAEQSEYAALYDDLLSQIESLKDRLSKRNMDYSNLLEDKKILDEKLSKLDNIEAQYSNKVSRLQNEIDSLTEYKNEKSAMLLTMDEEMESLRDETAVLRKNNSENSYKIKSLENLMSKAREDLASAKRKERALEETLFKIKRERDDLIINQTDEDYVGTLVSKIDTLEKRLLNKDKEIERKEVDIQGLKFDKRQLKERIELIRKSKEDIDIKGITDVMDTHIFSNINLHYFKIKHELKYLKSYLRTYIDLLRENEDSTVKVVIIKNNEGLDDIYFNHMAIYPNLSEALDSGKLEFRLFPSATMFTGADDFQKSVGHLVVIDYIDTPENLLATSGFSRKFIVAIDSKLVPKMGYQGMPISLDSKSKLDMGYDKEIGESRHSDIKKALLKTKIKKFMIDENIIRGE